MCTPQYLFAIQASDRFLGTKKILHVYDTSSKLAVALHRTSMLEGYLPMLVLHSLHRLLSDTDLAIYLVESWPIHPVREALV